MKSSMQWFVSALIVSLIAALLLWQSPIVRTPEPFKQPSISLPPEAHPVDTIDTFTLSPADKAALDNGIKACNTTVFSMAYVSGSSGQTTATAIMTYLEGQGYLQAQAAMLTYDQIPKGAHLACQDGVFTVILGDR